MSEAQKRFNEATNQVDRAYWQGAIDGEAAELERIMQLLKGAVMTEHTEWIVALIKGEK